METVTDFISGGSKIHADGGYSHEIKRHLLLGRKAMTNLDSMLKARTLLCWQRSISQSYDFSSSHVWMWELNCKESWALKNWCFWFVVLEKTLESPLDNKEIQPVHPKEDQTWVFIERTDVEAETPILWPPDAKSWLTGKDPDTGKNWGQEENGATRMRWLDAITDSMDMSLGWTPGVSDGQGGLACCDSWGHKELDTTEQLNWTEETYKFPEIYNLPRLNQVEIQNQNKPVMWKETESVIKNLPTQTSQMASLVNSTKCLKKN